MDEKMKITAMYKDENIYRIVVSKNENKYEMVLEVVSEMYDSILLNMYSLTTYSMMTKEELKEILTIAAAFFEENFGYNNFERVVIVNSESQKIKSMIDEKEMQDGYKYTSIHELSKKEEYTGIHKLYSKNNFSKNDNEFIKEYENDYLHNHRIYKLQRKNPISWDEYFMALSKLTSMRSKDPNTQVGACIVSPEHKILSIGYNGAPKGIDDDYFPWARDGEPLNTKYMYVCHAEMNAISNYNGPRSDFEGSTLYVDLFPCNECAKLIIQAGIKDVVYLSDKYANTESNIAAKKLFDLAGVKYRPLKEENQKIITLSLNPKDK